MSSMRSRLKNNCSAGEIAYFCVKQCVLHYDNF